MKIWPAGRKIKTKDGKEFDFSSHRTMAEIWAEEEKEKKEKPKKKK